jgi:hypothetical protein
MSCRGLLRADLSGPIVPVRMNSNGYPFLSRRQVSERIEADPTFMAECMAIIEERHQRRVAGAAEAMGWMASDATKATKLAAKIASARRRTRGHFSDDVAPARDGRSSRWVIAPAVCGVRTRHERGHRGCSRRGREQQPHAFRPR